tara:strand:- start:831 stop:1517 length:687 start_codon:yes stop_codon:yes gene_type:complete
MKNKKHVLKKIIDAKIPNYPWPHMIIDNFLPKDLYDGIVDEVSKFTTSDKLKLYNIRAYHIYVNKSISLFPNSPYLQEYYKILIDEEILETLVKKLSLTETPKDFYSELGMFTQGFNYQEIHPDRSDKAITMLHYLADEGDDELLGTFMYDPCADGDKLDVFKDRLKIAPYIPNCVLFFAPRDEEKFKTLHCMANNSKETFLRKSLQNFWIKEPSDWTKDPQTGRIKL